MDGMIVSILIALSVAALVFGFVQVVTALTDGKKKKLKQRLSTELRPDQQGGGAAKQITLAQQDFGLFGHFSPLEKLGKKLMQAYPDASLQKFLALCTAIAIIVFIVAQALLGI